MRYRIFIFSALFMFIIGCLFSCKERGIPVYSIDDSSIMFMDTVREYSLKGMTDSTVVLNVPFRIIGPATQYERPLPLKVLDTSINTAAYGMDFAIEENKLDPGALSGHVYLKVKNLPDEVEKLSTTLIFEKSESFPRQFKGFNKIHVVWSKVYIRPSNSCVYDAWWHFFCPGYSRKLHELLIEEFGPEIEKSGYSNDTRKDSTLTWHAINWWYNASRQFYNKIKEHDQADMDNPYYHSADYETYNSYKDAVGSGFKPSEPPTILSTLMTY